MSLSSDDYRFQVRLIVSYGRSHERLAHTTKAKGYKGFKEAIAWAKRHGLSSGDTMVVSELERCGCGQCRPLAEADRVKIENLP